MLLFVSSNEPPCTAMSRPPATACQPSLSIQNLHSNGDMFVVRVAVSADIEQIIAMDRSAQVDEFRRSLVNSAVEAEECFVAETNGVLLGCGLMNYGFFGRGFIPLIHVGTAQRRSRIATSLFDKLEERCTSARIFTSANLSNLPMQGFLVSRRYVLSGVVQYLDEGDPELFYSKKLR